MRDTTTFPAPSTSLVILILGAGGREHALAFKLAQSPRVSKIYVCPGNGGTAMMGGTVENVALSWGGKLGFVEVVAWAKEREVDLVVPGPEQSLVDGVELAFRKGVSPSTSYSVFKKTHRGYHTSQLVYPSSDLRPLQLSSRDPNHFQNLSWLVTRSQQPLSVPSPCPSTPWRFNTSNPIRFPRDVVS